MRINDKEYNITPMSVFEVFEIARVLAPVLTFLALQTDRDKLRAGFPQAFCGLVQDYDKPQLDRVFATCLPHVSRQDGDGYAPVYVNGQLAYGDIDISTMLLLICEVVIQNKLLDFYAAPPSRSTGVQGGRAGSIGQLSQTEKAG